MNNRRKLLVDAFMLFDLGLMILAFAVAALAVQHQAHTLSIAAFFSMRVKVRNFVIFAFLVLGWHLIFKVSGLYASRRLSDRRSELADIVKATSVGTVAIFGGALVFNIKLVTALFLAVFWLVSTCTVVSSRLFLRAGLAFVRRRGRNLRNMVVVGTNARALEFARKLNAHPELGCRVVGFVDETWHGAEEFQRSGYALSADFSSFPQFLRHSAVDEVVMALPFRSMYTEGSRIAALCQEHGIAFRVLTSVFDLKRADAFGEELEGNSLIIPSATWMEGWPLFFKRVVDLTISSMILAFLCPVLLVVGVLIKLTSPGEIFFVQDRLGLNKRHFKLYKFRTMVADAEKRMKEIEHLNEVSGPVFKIRNDPRITPIGRFLRRTSIDELPQLLNVLKGDMSLVGPRPLPARDYEGFNEDWQRRRFSVMPGITCLWQVQGRSSIPFEKWMELDLQYIDKWSLWLDFEILLRTVPAVLRGLGAA
jgi:exopolysaccharide biosynthesis polyprenyl glycosylphosphotransferase